MEESYKYFAFISYSHRDEKWAKFIQDELEGYKLPNVIRKEVNRELPKRIHPIFRDATDLGVGLLEDNLKAELAESKYLIVICSPNSAKENADGKCWVDSEVHYYARELKRGNRIIPIIIEGTPNEAFCKTLKQMECLALDATKHQKARIVNDVVAKILGLKPDDLWQRELRRRRRQRLFRSVAVSVVISVCTYGGWYAWDWNREKIAYFADYIDCFAIPQGRGELTREQLVGRRQTYRFHYQGYDKFLPWSRQPMLRKVFCVNSFDRVCEEHNEVLVPLSGAGLRLYYDEMGKVTKVEELSVNGTVCAVRNYTGQMANMVEIVRRGTDGRFGTARVDIVISDEVGSGGFVGRESDNARRCGRLRLTRNKDGLIIGVECLSAVGGMPALDGEGVHRRKFELDDSGRIVRESYWTWHGARQTRIAADGDAKYDERTFAYDGDGNVTKVCLSLNGKNVRKWCFEHDSHGNVIIQRRKSLDDKVPISGWAERRSNYDNHGEVIAEADFNEEGKPCGGMNSSRKRKVKYHEGFLVESDISYFDECGKPGRLNEFGTSRDVERYDLGGRLVEYRRYGQDGDLLRSKNACAFGLMRYDIFGREIETSIYDADGKLMANGAGCARRVETFETDGESVIRTRMTFGADGGPVADSESGAQRTVVKYGSTGLVDEIRLFEANGVPILNSLGWHRVSFRYDRFGFLSEFAYFGIDGKTSVMGCGFGYPGKGPVARETFVNDDSGHRIEETCYSVDGKRMVCSAGWSTMKCVYNEKGDLMEESVWDSNGSPVAACVKEGLGRFHRGTQKYRKDGTRESVRVYAIDGSYHEWNYSETGVLVNDCIFAADGLPRVDERGIHCTLFKRDEQGREIRRGFLNAKRRPWLNEDRVAGWATVYDANGDVVEVANFGLSGELVADKRGVSITRWEFDAQHHEIAKTYYDVHSNCVEDINGDAGLRKAYDAMGNLVEGYRIDRLGRARADKFGIAITRLEYDDQKRIVRRNYYSSDKTPVLNANGIAGWTSEYDGETDKEICRRFFGLDGRPCRGASGAAGWQKKYDKHGNAAEDRLIDEEGKPFADKDGIVGWRRRFDDRSRPIEVTAFGLRDEPCAMSMPCGFVRSGIARARIIRYRYDERGRKTEAVELLEPVGNVAKVEKAYDLFGKVHEETALDAKGRLTDNPEGFANIVSDFDAFHELSERRWYNAANELRTNGYARIVYNRRRMAKGLVVISRTYDAEDLPKADEDGVAYRRIEYDQHYRRTAYEQRDAEMNLVDGCNGRDYASYLMSYDTAGRMKTVTSLKADGAGAFPDGIATIDVDYLSENQVTITAYDATKKKIRQKTTHVSDIGWLRKYIVVHD